MAQVAARKKSEPRERRYVVEYVRTRYPDTPALFNVKLGGIPAKLNGMEIEGISANIARPWNRYADALVLAGGRLILVEAKLPAKVEAVAQLLFYRGLIPKTPALDKYVTLPVELVMVTAMPDPELVAYAQAQGVRVEIFQPSWALKYLSALLKGEVLPSEGGS